jgi:hypothetical protein
MNAPDTVKAAQGTRGGWAQAAPVSRCDQLQQVLERERETPNGVGRIPATLWGISLAQPGAKGAHPLGSAWLHKAR